MTDRNNIVIKLPIKLIIGATRIPNLQIPLGMEEYFGFKPEDVNNKFSIILYKDGLLKIEREQ